MARRSARRILRLGFRRSSDRERDLAFTAFSWVPLHARHVVAAEGFTDFTARPRRLRRFLDTYGWPGDIEAFVEVVRSRAQAHADGIRRLATAGDPLFLKMAALFP